MESDLISKLKEYLKNTPREEVLKDWNKSSECDSVGQTIEEYLEYINGWISVEDSLPEPLETVWLSDGKGWSTLGCRNDNYDGVWSWAETNGIIYEENGKIVSECDSDDLDVLFWHRIPKPPIV
jgi:hypothetical protein